ncbi:MAG: hypothetical protein E7576_17540 [Ruminococcaceae bacterium]|jgi:alpha-L-rhamnosidase|nr:hypothetical protein [Oscillospiraceae bacterium]
MKAVWIKRLYEEKNVAVTFQYRLTPSADATLTLAASNLYRLFVNGELIGYGPARAAHGYSRTDVYPLGAYSGRETVLSVEVYSANTNTFYIVDEPPFFAAEIREGGEVVASAEDFTAYPMTERVQKVRRFSFQRAYTEVYRLTGDPMAFYAGDPGEHRSEETEPVPMNKLLPRYAHMPKLNTVPASPVEHGTVSVDESRNPFRDRSYDNIDPVKFKGFTPDELEADPNVTAAKFVYRRTAEGGAETLPPLSYQVYDFGRTCTGFFSFTVQAEKGTELTLVFDEIATERGDHLEVSPFRNSCCNVIQYSFSESGTYRIVSFEANAARYAAAVVRGGCAKIASFGMVLYENPDAAGFRYDYGDDALNRITEAAVNTFAQNAVDVLTDCPSRERAGWLCDSYFSSRAEALFTGNNLVEKSFLENYALCPPSRFLPEGMIPMCYPADHNDGVYIPNWSMWYILELRNYVRCTGDETMAKISRDKVYGLVKFFERFYNEDGLLENLESWVFIEWSKCNDGDYIRGVNYPSNMLWAAALEAVDDLYADPALRKKAGQMKETIRRLAFNGEFFEDNGVRDENGALVRTGHTTETCQYYAFYFGTASKEDYPALFETLVTRFGPKRDPKTEYPTVYPSNAIVGNYLRLELLLRWGFRERVLDECRDFFLGMAELTDTLWEHAQLSSSLNHGFASMAAVYIHECMKDKT